MKNKTAVLGGGASGQMFAADLAFAGWEVHLYELPEFSNGIRDVINTRQIEIVGDQSNSKGFKRGGTAEISVVTTDIPEALDGVDLINVCVPANGHKAFFEQIIPHLRDGHIISIFPDNFGSLVLRKMLRDRGVDVDIIVGGWVTMPGAYRLVKAGQVWCINRLTELRGDTLPSGHWDDFLKIMKDFPALEPADIVHGDTVIDIGLSNANPVLHCVGTVLSIGAMEHAPPQTFDLYREGISPSIVKVMVDFHHEQYLIAQALGVDMVLRGVGRWTDRDQAYDSFMSRLNLKPGPAVDQAAERPPMGPFSVETRYFSEDIPIGTCARYSLAKYLNVDVPVIESIIRLASAVCGKDFTRECRSIEEMGLSGLSRDKILRYLREGNTGGEVDR